MKHRVVFGLISLLASALLLGAGFAQSREPRFETISIRPFDPKTAGGFAFGDPLVFPGGLYRDPFAALLTLITESYDVKDSSRTLMGLPEWAKSTAWSIVARPGPDYTAATAQENTANVKAMIRSMLAERFKLKIHQEERPTKVLVLRVKEGGAKLHSAPAPVPPEKEGSIRMVLGDRRGSFVGKKVTIGQLATTLTIFLPQVVVDRTGLTGFYDFDEKWEAAYRQGDPVPPTSLGPDGLTQLISYLDQNLGLVLKSETAPVQHWIVDHVEKPDVN